MIVEVLLQHIAINSNLKMSRRMVMSREQLLELEEVKRGLLRQAYRMKQECPHMSPVGLESEMYAAIMAEVREITSRIQRSAEA